MRQLATMAGLTGPVLFFLSGRAQALARNETTDVAILNAALALENEAIALYADALQSNRVPTLLRPYAIEFKGSHEGHRDTQIEILRERGVEPQAPRARVQGGVAQDAAGQRTIERLLQIEAAAEAAYLALISQIRTNDYLLTAAFIVVDEARHQTIWRRTLGYSIY